MNDKPNDAVFVDRVKRALDEGTDRLAPGVISGLNQARYRALEAVDRSESPRPRWMAVKLTGLLAACCAILAIGLWMQPPTPSPISAALADVEILAAEDGFELYEELDFFTWLAQERADAG
ncbi:MAG TPA: hypothetical protein ACFCUC_08740 [Desulfobacterales bacterium]